MMLRWPRNKIPIAGPNGNRKLVKEWLVWGEDWNDLSIPEMEIFEPKRSQLNGQTSNAPSEGIDFRTRLDVGGCVPILHPEDSVMWVRRPNAAEPNLHIGRKRKRTPKLAARNH
jgi:hypothetical protein